MAELSFWEKVKEKEEEGKRRAKLNEPTIRANVMTRDRYQASIYLRNMVKALGLMTYENTVEDWQRLYEAKYLLKVRASRKRS
jgi:hypothetical protein